jgi:RimJ/RimL family protein N-acetyltransferase
MLKLKSKNIYLAVLEKKHCQILWDAYEYDEKQITYPLNIGHSVIKADDWFDEIQRLQGNKNIRLGIFLLDDTVIGDVALQDIDWRNRSCSVGLGIQKLEHRSKGYGSEAVLLMLEYGFNNLGLNRIWANTLESNISAQRSLEKTGFVIEGRSRQAEYYAGRYFDKLHYGLLRDEYNDKHKDG